MAVPIQALLFDLDGTLIDSMPLHHEAWRAWHARHGLPFDDAGFFGATAGRTNAEILRDLLPASSDAERETLAEEKEALYRASAATSLRMIAGFEPLRAEARALGLKLAICTAAPLANIAVAVRRFGLDSQVDAITSPADGLRGKPHPDIFEEAARRLRVPPAACLVFEDAPLGIEAARRAGMPAVALTTSLSTSAFAGYDNLRLAIADFQGLDITALLTVKTTRDTQNA